MAYGGSKMWEMICPLCSIFIDTHIDDDIQTSIDNHFLETHSTLHKISQTKMQPTANIKCPSEKNRHNLKLECDNYIFCPMCDCVIEIFQDNASRCFQEHFEIYHHNVTKPQTTDYTFTFGSKENLDANFKNVQDKQNCITDLGKLNSDSQSKRLYFLQSNFKNHHAYIQLSDNSFVCQICSIALDTTSLAQEHLKSKRHEDNVIMHLKNKLPSHMLNVMEFVSFYDSNLCCNLCRCKIELNSTNPHETLINIISHNLDKKHSKNKSHEETNENKRCDSVMRSITERNPVINKHRRFIDTEMEPKFKCNLCARIIHYSKNEHELEQNFLSHINSSFHNSNSEVIIVFQTFNEIMGKTEEISNYYVSNGCISCKQCKHSVQANIEQLLEHYQSHANASQLVQNGSQVSKPLSTGNMSTQNKKKVSPCQKPDLGRTRCTPSESSLNQDKAIRPKADKPKENKKLVIKEILQPLHKQLGNINFITENGEGSLTCLICNCPIQPTTHCVKMHIIGKFHKNKMQYQIKEFNNLNLNDGAIQQEPSDDLVDKIFQSLPPKFQEEKVNFRNCPIGGYISCALCECVINPLFLELHFLEKTHVREKQSNRP